MPDFIKKTHPHRIFPGFSQSADSEGLAFISREVTSSLTTLPPYDVQALTVMLCTALKLDDINAVFKYWDAFKDIVNPQAGKNLVALAGYLEKKGNPHLPLNYLLTKGRI